MTSRLDGCLLTSAADDELGTSLRMLGWAGVFLRGVSILGTRVSFVVAVDTDAHNWRIDQHCANAMLDPDELTVWEWPESAGFYPPSAVSIVGILAHEGNIMRDRLGSARKWRGFGPTAIAISRTERPTQRLLLECGYSEISLVGSGGTKESKLLVSGRSDRLATAKRTVVDRWVEEFLYGRLIGGTVLNTLLSECHRAEGSKPAA